MALRDSTRPPDRPAGRLEMGGRARFPCLLAPLPAVLSLSPVGLGFGFAPSVLSPHRWPRRRSGLVVVRSFVRLAGSGRGRAVGRSVGQAGGRGPLPDKPWV